MGYYGGSLNIPLRVSAHNSEQDDADRAAVESLKADIQRLIDGNPWYQRVALLGVEGGVD